MRDEAAPSGDDLLLQRALDGELRPSEAMDLERRLAARPELAERLRALESLRDLRSAARPTGGLGLDFADRVTARLFSDVDGSDPSARPDEDGGSEAAGELEDAAARAPRPIAMLDRGILVAALLLVALAISLMTRGAPADDTKLEANPEIRREVRLLTERFEKREQRQRLEREIREKQLEAERARGADETRGGK